MYVYNFKGSVHSNIKCCLDCVCCQLHSFADLHCGSVFSTSSFFLLNDSCQLYRSAEELVKLLMTTRSQQQQDANISGALLSRAGLLASSMGDRRKQEKENSSLLFTSNHSKLCVSFFCKKIHYCCVEFLYDFL